MLTPPGAPIANCFIESWIGSLKRECLNHFFCFSLKQLDHIVQTYGYYHNHFRPHQSLANEPLDRGTVGLTLDGDAETRSVRRQTWLGGLLAHYYRQAA